MKIFFKIFIISFIFFSFFGISNAGIDLKYGGNPNTINVIPGNFDYIRNKQIISSGSTIIFFNDSWSYFSGNKFCTDLRFYSSGTTINYYCNGVLFKSTTDFLTISTNNNLPIDSTFFNYYNFPSVSNSNTSSFVTLTGSNIVSVDGLTFSGEVNSKISDFPVYTSSGAFVSVNSNGGDTLGSVVMDIRAYLIYLAIIFTAFAFYLLMKIWLWLKN